MLKVLFVFLYFTPYKLGKLLLFALSVCIFSKHVQCLKSVVLFNVIKVDYDRT